MIPLLLGAMAFQAISTKGQMQASKKNQKIAENIAAFNAKVALRDADLAIEASETSATNIREQTTRLISEHQAAFGASNVVTTSGSPLAAAIRQRKEGEKAAQNELLKGNIAAAGYESQANAQGFQGRLARFKGKQERTDLLLTGLAQGASTGSKFI